MLSNCGLAFLCCTQGGFELYITSVGVAVARRPILGLPGLNRLWFGFPMLHAGRVSAMGSEFQVQAQQQPLQQQPIQQKPLQQQPFQH